MHNYFRITALVVVFLVVFSGCKTSKEAAPTKQATIQGRVHVLLAQGVGPDVLLDAFADYSFKKIGPASRSQNKHAYYYNAAAIEATKLEAELEKRKDVLDAQIMK
ncbi:MAG: hypothetical protein AAF597_17360 [Bacteroidota bacterium]